MEHLYSYDNYRRYLADYYEEHKRSESGFSWRVWSRRAGFGSPVFLKLVCDGTKNIGSTSIDRVAESCGFSIEETAYFHALVEFTHADTDQERNFHYSKMAEIRSRSESATIKNDQFDYFSEWYIPVIREVAAGIPVETPTSALTEMIRPKVTKTQAKHALSVLVRLGFLQNESGIWQQHSPLITTDPSVQSLAVRNFHDHMLTQASLALRELPRKERSLTGVVLKISGDGYEKISERIDQFRQELLAIAGSDSDVDRVCHLGIQLIPLAYTKETRV